MLRTYAIFNTKHLTLITTRGALERIRTSNPQSRNLIFYPVELREHKKLQSLYLRTCFVAFSNKHSRRNYLSYFKSSGLSLTILFGKTKGEIITNTNNTAIRYKNAIIVNL